MTSSHPMEMNQPVYVGRNFGKIALFVWDSESECIKHYVLRLVCRHGTFPWGFSRGLSHYVHIHNYRCVSLEGGDGV